MRAIRDLRAVSRLALILLFLIAMILGALMSYMFVMGYYVSIGFQVPPKTSVTIVNAAFSPQNARLFNISLLNPSYSPSNATVKQIAVVTGDDAFHEVKNVLPLLPYKIKPGESKNFTCYWNWSNHTNENIKIMVFIAEEQGSGATFQAETPFVGLTITEAQFNATISTLHFNLTVQNSALSATYVNITAIAVTTGSPVILQDVTPPLPLAINPNSSVTFKCPWNWTDYRSKKVTIGVQTAQGYSAYFTMVTPHRLILNITDVLFNPTDTAHFNVTVKSDPRTSISVTITGIKITLENGSVVEITQLMPALPYSLQPDTSVTFLCSWNWTTHQGKNVTVTVYTQEGYVVARNQAIPSLEEEAAASSKIFSLGNQNRINLAWLLSLSTSPPILRKRLKTRLLNHASR
ncbi:MAG: hypothetical protein QW231_04905 [Candidatus Bathyarchaeia archaeon]